MLSSVRLRLTLWYAGVLALVLVLFATAVYTASAEESFARLDAELASVAEIVSQSLRHEIEEHKGQAPGEEAFRDVMRTMHQASFPLQAIVVLQGSRQVAFKPSYDQPRPPVASLAGAGREPAFLTSGKSRLVLAHAEAPGVAEPYRVIVSQRVDGTLAELGFLRRSLYFSVPLAVALAGMVGYLLARKSLEPVMAMSNAADRIGSGNLADRIEVVNPGDELGRLAATFNRLLERLQVSFERQRRFMADASHELRTPIAVARTAAQVNLEGGERPAEEYRDALALVEKQMARLTRLVGDMSLLARTDSGAAVIDRRRFALRETIEEAVRSARVLAAAKQIAVDCGEMAEAPFDGDEDLILRLLLLLLDNAVKYTPSGGSVHVTLRRAHEAYEIAVADTGAGIPPEAQPLIFERFYRADKARARCSGGINGAGAGLGLSIGKWIAEVHGGDLSLRSSSADGSVFVVRLPSAK